MENTKYYWKWWWGDSVLGTVKDEMVFYDFDEMKRFSSKHSFENSICQQNYYSNYSKHSVDNSHVKIKIDSICNDLTQLSNSLHTNIQLYDVICTLDAIKSRIELLIKSIQKDHVTEIK